MDSWATIRETYHPIHHWLFQTVRHPNIFLIIIPELVGLALLCHAKYSLIFLSNLYEDFAWTNTRGKSAGKRNGRIK